jgi:diacylglycerol kinase family enzyme
MDWRLPPNWRPSAKSVPVNVELVKHWQGKDIKISVSPKQKAECDGEVLEIMPSRIKVVPAAIKVLVPQEDKKVP